MIEQKDTQKLTHREIGALAFKYATLCGGNEKVRMAEFKKLLLHPDIEKAEIDGVRLTIHTEPIFLNEMSIGCFTITIDLKGREHPKLRNKRGAVLTSLFNAAHHPHIFYESGEICWGNMGNAISQLVSQKSHAALVSACIQFLKNYQYDFTGGEK